MEVTAMNLEFLGITMLVVSCILIGFAVFLLVNDWLGMEND